MVSRCQGPSQESVLRALETAEWLRIKALAADRHTAMGFAGDPQQDGPRSFNIHS